MTAADTTHATTALAGRVIVARPTRDRELLRTFLERDRLAAAYAICDLEDEEFGQTHWGVASEADQPIAVVLQYDGLSPQPMFVMGDGAGIGAVLREVIRPRVAFVASAPALLPEIDRFYALDPGPPMLRMWVDRASFRPADGGAVRLLPPEVADLNRLYGLSFTTSLPADTISRGVYYGVRVAGRLVAAAGTHVISHTARLAAVGNVMTHPDHRGRGLAKRTTGAVTAELLHSCDQVVLNVRSDNPPAIAAYRALGYREHTRFEERLARRRGGAWDSILGQLRRLLQANEDAH